jgi:hypothetical protein
MENSVRPDALKMAVERLDSILDPVLERGWDDSFEFDDYSVLLRQLEYRKATIFQIYESYFPPKRHEFELASIHEIVDTIWKNPAAVFLRDAVISGVAGSMVYDLLKRLISHIVGKFGSKSSRAQPFLEIASDLEKLNEYFQHNEEGEISKISSTLGINPEKAVSLLKVMGFKSKRRGKKIFWVRPFVIPKPDPERIRAKKKK